MTTSPVVTITEELVEELEALAESAIPGPWFADSYDGDRYVSPEQNGETAVANVLANDFDDETGRWFAGGLTEATHAFMAMANPSTILALLAERAAMQSQIKAGIVTQDNLELYRKDALRYQWLRNRHNASGEYLCVTDGEDGVIIEDVVGVDGLDLDAAIDQAMQEQQP